MTKPRIYWTYYPKLQRGFWRVSPMPAGTARSWQRRRLWAVAHRAVIAANMAIDPVAFGECVLPLRSENSEG